jgi:hypothetical protein
MEPEDAVAEQRELQDVPELVAPAPAVGTFT